MNLGKCKLKKFFTTLYEVKVQNLLEFTFFYEGCKKNYLHMAWIWITNSPLVLYPYPSLSFKTMKEQGFSNANVMMEKWLSFLESDLEWCIGWSALPVEGTVAVK